MGYKSFTYHHGRSETLKICFVYLGENCENVNHSRTRLMSVLISDPFFNYIYKEKLKEHTISHWKATKKYFARHKSHKNANKQLCLHFSVNADNDVSDSHLMDLVFARANSLLRLKYLLFITFYNFSHSKDHIYIPDLVVLWLIIYIESDFKVCFFTHTLNSSHEKFTVEF